MMKKSSNNSYEYQNNFQYPFVSRDFNKVISIKKLGKPVKRFLTNSFKSVEKYKGEENLMNVKDDYKGTFTCTFTNIRNYPFGSESCNVIIMIAGSDLHLTNLNLIDLQYLGERMVNEFQITKITAGNATGFFFSFAI